MLGVVAGVFTLGDVVAELCRVLRRGDALMLQETFFCLSSRSRHTRFACDWSSDVCSSDLASPCNPNRYRPHFGLQGEAEDLRCADAVEQEIVAQGPEYVAAVIGEPVSVSNSNHVPSPKYWERLREICDKHGVLLVMGEGINGVGRAGPVVAAEHFGVGPRLSARGQGPSAG